MPDIEKLTRNLEREGFSVSRFATAKECSDYLDAQLDGAVIGFGGSQTVRDMGLFDRLKIHNECIWHWDPERKVVPEEATGAEVYISSFNGVSENGELINIDGRGNRAASTLFGHKKLYFIIGVNKILPDYASALDHARNVAGPLNAKRLGVNTPCVKVGHCCDCRSPERICRALVVFWEKPFGCGEAEIIIVEEPLGY